MIERDNKDIQFTHLAMENVRLQNLVLEYEEELRLRDVEDAADKAQTAEMLASKDRQIAEQAALIESQKKDIERITADRDQERDSRIKAEEEKKALIIQLNQQKQDHEEELKELLPAKEMLAEAEKNNVDCKAVIKMMLNREYNTNSDATRYMNGELCLDDPMIQVRGADNLCGTEVGEKDILHRSFQCAGQRSDVQQVSGKYYTGQSDDAQPCSLLL